MYRRVCRALSVVGAVAVLSVASVRLASASNTAGPLTLAQLPAGVRTGIGDLPFGRVRFRGAVAVQGASCTKVLYRVKLGALLALPDARFWFDEAGVQRSPYYDVCGGK